MKLFTILLIAAFFITGCSNVRTYTFKRNRVDQKVQEGNRGYLKGTPPPAEERKDVKRTMYGVDVEIPILPWDAEASLPPKPKEGTVEVPPKEEEKTIVDISVLPISAEKKSVETKQAGPTQIKGEVVEEEEWIK